MRHAVINQAEDGDRSQVTVAYFSKASLIGPSSRYRIFQFMPYLRAAGVNCRVYPLFGPAYFRILEIRIPAMRVLAKAGYVIARFVKRVWDMLTMPAADLVVIEGQLFPYVPAAVERLILRAFPRVAVELDDAIYLTRFHGRKIPALLKSASAAIVGNETLARYARGFCSRVEVIPTVVDTDYFRPRKADEGIVLGASGKAVTVVWVGLAYNLPYLEFLAPVLSELSAQGLIRLRVVCSRPPNLEGVEVEFRRWNLERETEDLADGQIGIMPLPDTEWARGKCGLKLLQYMACSMATIASPVGVSAEIVRDGETGFHSSSLEDWRDGLSRLCRDGELRARFGQAGRRRVEDQYSLRMWGPRLAEWYLEAANDALVSGLIGESAPAAGRVRTI